MFPSPISGTVIPIAIFVDVLVQILHAETAAQIVRAQCLDPCSRFGFLCLQRNETLNSNNNCLFQSGPTITFVM